MHAVSPSLEASVHRHRRILVVDDDPDIVTLYEINLELAGYEVARARDGAEALRNLRTGLRPDCMILDIMMPRVDGWGVLAGLARDDLLADLPVVMVSAKVTDQDRERAFSMGVDGVLEKPFLMAAVLQAVEQATTVPSAKTG